MSLTTVDSGLISSGAITLTTQVTGTLPEANGGTGTTVGYCGFKNRIINGGMVIDQRNAGASGTAMNVYTVDRWQFGASLSTKGTWQQNAGAVTPPVGFTNYLGFTSNSAYSVAAGDYFQFLHPIEGYNTADLAFGTANAKTITVSFQVYSSLTGTFGGCISNNTSTRTYPFTYSIPVANTWTSISITIAGDTSGTWQTTNSGGITVHFGLGTGTTYSAPSSGSWVATNYVQPTGTVSVVGTSGATFYITGVQLEKGSTATSFDYRPYGTELALCQRYYQQLGNVAYVNVGTGFQQSTTTSYFYIKYNTTMRASPTFSVNNLIVSDRSTFDVAVSAISAQAGLDSAYINVTSAAGGAARYPVFLAPANATTGYLSITAEL